ncbi:hypothetical protein CHH68_05050 [Bacillus velezensis]|nr:hypothetical protein CHH68_05050 [Bacillus velezensis]
MTHGIRTTQVIRVIRAILMTRGIRTIRKIHATRAFRIRILKIRVTACFTAALAAVSAGIVRTAVGRRKAGSVHKKRDG